jgi:hypothetical protein
MPTTLRESTLQHGHTQRKLRHRAAVLCDRKHDERMPDRVRAAAAVKQPGREAWWRYALREVRDVEEEAANV